MMKHILFTVIFALFSMVTLPMFAQSDFGSLVLTSLKKSNNQAVYQIAIPSSFHAEDAHVLIESLKNRDGISFMSVQKDGKNLRFSTSDAFVLSTYGDLDNYLPAPRSPHYFMEGSSPHVSAFLDESLPADVLSKIRTFKVMSLTSYQALNEADRNFIDTHPDLYFVSSELSLSRAYQRLIKELM